MRLVASEHVEGCQFEHTVDAPCVRWVDNTTGGRLIAIEQEVDHV